MFGVPLSARHLLDEPENLPANVKSLVSFQHASGAQKQRLEAAGTAHAGEGEQEVASSGDGRSPAANSKVPSPYPAASCAYRHRMATQILHSFSANSQATVSVFFPQGLEQTWQPLLWEF